MIYIYVQVVVVSPERWEDTDARKAKLINKVETEMKRALDESSHGRRFGVSMGYVCMGV